MAHPFFSGQIPHSPTNDEGLTSYEIYHRLLIAYPAYTIEKIETELSWRQVRLLLDCWEDVPPLANRVAGIERMLELRFGVKKTGVKKLNTKPLNSDEFINQLSSMGWL